MNNSDCYTKTILSEYDFLTNVGVPFSSDCQLPKGRRWSPDQRHQDVQSPICNLSHCTTFAGVPSKKFFTFCIIIFISLLRASKVAHATCGVIRQFFA